MSSSSKALLTPVDAAWLGMDSPGNPLVITALMRVEGLEFETLERLLRERLLRWERFSQRPVRHGGSWWWELMDELDWGEHIRAHAPCDSESALREQVDVLVAEPFPHSGPLWCCHYLPMADGAHGLLFRIHHCYGDGMSLIRVFESMSDASHEAEALDVVEAIPGDGGPDRVERAWSWAQQQLAQMMSGVRHGIDWDAWARIGMKLSRELADYLLQPPDAESSLRRRPKGEKACAWSDPIPLDTLRDTSRQLGCSLNDLFLAAVGEALQGILARRDEYFGGQRFHCAIPVDLRSMLPEPLQPPEAGLSNAFGTVFVPMPMDAEKPLERVYRIKHETRRLKNSWQPLISWGLLCAGGYLPALWQQPLVQLMSHRASVVVSNVPGTEGFRYLAGCRVRDQVFWVPQAGSLGLGISIISYAGHVRFGVLADNALEIDACSLAEACEQALATMGGGDHE